MHTEDDFEYFMARAIAERAASEAAVDKSSRDIHALLAAKYEGLADRLKGPRPTLHIVSPGVTRDAPLLSDETI